MSNLSDLKINNYFSNSLPADPIEGKERRQVYQSCFSYVKPTSSPKASIVHVCDDMAKLLGVEDLESNSFLQIVSGTLPFKNSKPYAMCYGGHQFGNWAGQLGDGRAINIGEVENNNGVFSLQLKGAGETPYSRGADGLAVLRSSIREYLCSEAMHHLGVPSTRVLSLAISGEEVMRDVLYNGNPALEKGAIVCRVSESFIRFGNFEIFAARQDKETLTKLVDFTINQYFSELGKPGKETYLKFFQEVVDRTKSMILHWQRVGFVHGVMNTDNMSILGQTIDYGPYGWLEDYDPNWTPNTTDAQHRRYRYGHQPSIGLWNLTQLANAIYPLIDEVEPLQDILRSYKNSFQDDYLKMMMSKIGITEKIEGDQQFIEELQQLLEATEVDMTMFFRNLADFEETTSFIFEIKKCSYQSSADFDKNVVNWKFWLEKYTSRLQLSKISSGHRKKQMNIINPKYVLRNYIAQLVIDKANEGDYSLLNEVYLMLKKPYVEQPANEKWFAKRPVWANEKIGCSMLSCSS